MTSGERASRVDQTQAARLLAVCGRRNRRAVDLLIEHLEESGSEGLEDLLASGPAPELLSPRSSANELRRLKELCKSDSGRGVRGQLERLAGYFTAVAAALCHHEQHICSRPLSDLDPILIDLASVTSGSWYELFEGAARIDES